MLDQTDRMAPPAARATRTGAGQAGRVARALAQACSRVSPVWDIKSFIAANSLGGFEHRPFPEAVRAARAYFHADALMPLSFYHEQRRAGRIRPHDLAVALDEARRRPEEVQSQGCKEVHTLAGRIDRASGTRYEALIVGELAKWCAAYFDQGQAAWPMPGREGRFYDAWREVARFDASCRVGGIPAFAEVIAALPDTPAQAVEQITAALGVPPDDLADYLTRLLTRLPGWSGYALFRSRQSDGETGDLGDLVAAGLAYEWTLVLSLVGPAGVPGWEAVRALEAPFRENSEVEAARLDDLEGRLAWQSAYERGYRQELLAALTREGLATAPEIRPAAQAVFCIDVRSEPLRRHLERLRPAGHYQTLGFAGFFGFPLAHRPFAGGPTTARCPALLQPRFTVPEQPAGEKLKRAAAGERLWRSLASALAGAKSAAASSYFFVESLGLLFGAGGLLRAGAPGVLTGLRQLGRLALGGAAPTRPVIDPPCCPGHADEVVGIPAEEQAVVARTALRIMGLTRDFGRLVLLCGHGGSSSNNPYAAALDCGACGGHEGGFNARVAAVVFNRPEIRARLAQWGIVIPCDTWFVAGRHDTTTDEVALLDSDLVPPSHAADLADLAADLARAGEAARRERAARFGLGDDPRRRARDWSEVRPEWGLAGNAAFIAGPRSLTAGVDLKGRAFLHSYDWQADSDGTALEVILTAPLVVAEWINMQYFLSTVDNCRFGSGDKVLHNVVGKLGVVLGNHGDLQVGLPLQSVSDGARPVHEPLRLLAVVQAPRERIQAIIDKHDSVRRLVDNEWLTLVALDPAEAGAFRYLPGGGWGRELPEGGEDEGLKP